MEKAFELDLQSGGEDWREKKIMLSEFNTSYSQYRTLTKKVSTELPRPRKGRKIRFTLHGKETLVLGQKERDLIQREEGFKSCRQFGGLAGISIFLGTNWIHGSRGIFENNKKD